MDEKGGDRPSRNLKEQKHEPSGVQVKPGTYRIVLSYGDQSSEQMIDVESDPRIKNSESNTNQIYTASKEIQKLRQTAADAVKQLNQSKEIAATYKGRLSKMDKEKYKSEVKLSKKTIARIDSLVSLYIGKVDKRQGITKDTIVNVNNRLGTASYYVQTRQNGITKTETILINQAKKSLKEALLKTNLFFKEEWLPYKEKMEKLVISPFKETEVFKIN